jgi:hypothetical protein
VSRGGEYVQPEAGQRDELIRAKSASEVAAMLIKPAGVVNTGDTGGSLTAVDDDSLA